MELQLIRLVYRIINMRIVVLGSGSKGNSTFIDLGEKKILIDVGFTYKHIKEQLSKINVDPKEIDAVFITHDHSDHTYGLKVFLKQVKPTLFITPEVEKMILGGRYENSEYLLDEMFFGGAIIKAIPLSHDSLTINGFLIEKDGESVVYITDTGYVNLRHLIKLKNKTYYIFESNHDSEMLIKGPYPKYLQDRILSDKGHMSNELAGGYLARLIGPNTKKIILAHLSETNNTPKLALDTVNKVLKENDIVFEDIIPASQSEITEVSV